MLHGLLKFVALFALLGAMVVAPIATSAAHVSEAAFAVSALNQDGHVHASEQQEVHDAIDHAHDASVVIEHPAVGASPTAQGWPVLHTAFPALAKQIGPERPPKSA